MNGTLNGVFKGYTNEYHSFIYIWCIDVLCLGKRGVLCKKRDHINLIRVTMIDSSDSKCHMNLMNVLNLNYFMVSVVLTELKIKRDL